MARNLPVDMEQVLHQQMLHQRVLHATFVEIWPSAREFLSYEQDSTPK